MNVTTDDWGILTSERRRDVETRLEPGETVLALFEPDLDERLLFARGLVVLTDRRLLALVTGPSEGNGASPHWQAWPLDNGAELRGSERGLLGSLEYVTPLERLAHFRYTPGQSQSAHRLVQTLCALRAASRALRLHPQPAFAPVAATPWMPSRVAAWPVPPARQLPPHLLSSASPDLPGPGQA